MALSILERKLARTSLVMVWLGTALVSAWQADGISRELLGVNDKVPPMLYPWVIWGGSGVDLMLGLWMAFKPGRAAYLCAMGMTLVMTLVGTWVDPALWLHPLGPISKNLPIMVLLWLLAQEHTS